MRLITGLLLAAALGSAQQYFSVPGVDAPELARLGPYKAGVRTIELVNPGQVDILSFDKATGKAPLYDRPLTVEVWYPSAATAEGNTVFERKTGGRNPITYRVHSKALREAVPAQGGPFPLVIVSHGYPGDRTTLLYLSENLATKGYVVAAIEHTDSVAGAAKGFQSTLLNRANDQLFTVGALGELARKPGHFLNGLADGSKVAIVGYSMGGYGALASAGAGYSKTSMAARFVPGGYFEEWTASHPKFEARRRPELKAIVAIAPWGAQPPQNHWDDAGLAGIRIPSLFISGDHDDISGYEQGIKPAFEKAVNSDRCLLVYENANHNVGGNPPPEEALNDFVTREQFDEPVWRKDRIIAINQHFVTAFLDLHLKGDESRRSYLQVPVIRSSEAKWPLAPGQSVAGRYSKGAEEGPNHTWWKGFQRRWLMGLQMHCRPAAR